MNGAVFNGKVRDRSPETSWEAATLQTKARTGQVKAAIVVLLRAHGPMTDDQLVSAYNRYQAQCSWVPRVTPQSVRTRRHELHVAGGVRPTGERRPSNAGNPAQVWALTAKEAAA